MGFIRSFLFGVLRHQRHEGSDVSMEDQGKQMGVVLPTNRLFTLSFPLFPYASWWSMLRENELGRFASGTRLCRAGPCRGGI